MDQVACLDNHLHSCHLEGHRITSPAAVPIRTGLSWKMIIGIRTFTRSRGFTDPTLSPPAPRRRFFNNRRCLSQVWVGSCRQVPSRWAPNHSLASRGHSSKCSEKWAIMSIKAVMSAMEEARASGCGPTAPIQMILRAGFRRPPQRPGPLVRQALASTITGVQ